MSEQETVPKEETLSEKPSSRFNRHLLRDWFLSYAEKPHARWWLAFFSFIESSFFPVPRDPLLVAILAANRSRWLWDALISTAASIVGGLFGYLIGVFLWDTLGSAIVAAYGLEEEMAMVGRLFADNAFLAIFLAAFTPIPYKVFTIAAGLFGINIPVFIIASILGRGGRFFAVSFLMKLFGEKISPVIFKYFDLLTVLMGAYIVFLFASLKFF